MIFTKKGTKTEFVTNDVGERYNILATEIGDKQTQIEILQKEIAILDKELRSLEFIKNELKK